MFEKDIRYFEEEAEAIESGRELKVQKVGISIESKSMPIRILP